MTVSTSVQKATQPRRSPFMYELAPASRISTKPNRGVEYVKCNLSTSQLII